MLRRRLWRGFYTPGPVGPNSVVCCKIRSPAPRRGGGIDSTIDGAIDSTAFLMRAQVKENPKPEGSAPRALIRKSEPGSRMALALRLIQHYIYIYIYVDHIMIYLRMPVRDSRALH